MCLCASHTLPGEGSLLSETMGPRKRLPPLLVPLTDRKPERLHYLGRLVSNEVLLVSGCRGCA